MRRNTGSSSQTISLFPFLAVLICMMGALVLLLLGLTSTMRQRLSRPVLAAIPAPAVEQPADRDAPRPPPPPSPGGFDEETVVSFRVRQEQERQSRWQALIHQSASERDEVRAALQAKQSELSQRQARLDELSVRLKSQADQSVTEQATTEMLQERQKQSELELEFVTREIALTERKLEELKQQQSAASNAHAILPYDGRSGTTRRPIYIECTDKGYRFLPENVFVGPNELRGATPHSNALAFGAKALLRYWTLRNVRDPGHHPRPYLLLIVRPGGVFAYDAARQLLSRLESSFGYELVEDEIILQKLPPDPHAVALLKEAIALASEPLGERPQSSRNDSPRERFEDGLPGHLPGAADEDVGLGGRGRAVTPESKESDRELTGRGPAPSRPNTLSEGGASRAGTPAPPSGAARPRTIRDPLPKARPASLGGRPGGLEDDQDVSRGSGSQELIEEAAPPRRLPSQKSSRGVGLLDEAAATAGSPGDGGQVPDFAGQREVGASLPHLPEQIPVDGPGVASDEVPDLSRNAPPGQQGDRPAGGSQPTGLENPPTKPGPDPGASGAQIKSQEFRQEPGNQELRGPRTNERSPIRKPGEGPESAGTSAAGEVNLMPPRGTHGGGGAPRNLIALQRKILIRVEQDRVWVGEENPIEIPVKKNQKAEQLIAQVTSAMREVTESWGPPPARFYWNPAVRFEVTREGNPVYERLRGAFERQKVKSSIDFVESNSRQAARRTP